MELHRARPSVRTSVLAPLALAALALALGVAAAPAGAATRVVAWNNLGMHCLDDSFAVFSLLPPYNTLLAQVTRDGVLVTDPTGLEVTYHGVADPSGSINTTSQGKTDFWQHVVDLFGVSLPPDVGLVGSDMPGPANTPRPTHFDATSKGWIAEGIPLTPRDDAGHRNTYPLMRVEVRDASTQALLASTDVVLPVSDEMDCRGCHASGSGPAARPAEGWVNDPDPVRDHRLNILRLHDEKQAGNTAYAGLLTGRGYRSDGLFPTVTLDGKAILCASCHLSEALSGSGVAGVPALTRAMHAGHAAVADPQSGIPLDDAANRSACYRCHPGSVTRCLRGAMGSAVAADGTLAMQCQSCHGAMHDVGDASRTGWLDEPRCQSCHTGTATLNTGQIRYTNAFDAPGHWRVPAATTFATTPDVPAAGYSLYRFSSGHGGLACESCHGATHAEYPSSEPNDNLQSVALQGHAGMLSECTTCHATTPATVAGGPHGLHPLGASWVGGHGDAVESVGYAACRACHGADDRGTVLSRAQADRTLSTRYGTVHLWRGYQVSCFTCHNGPGSEQASPNHPAQVSDAQAATDDVTPVAIPLVASDADGDPLTLRIVSQPTRGTVGLAGDVATYFPEAGARGSFHFTFAANDGFTDSNLGAVQVAVPEPGAGLGLLAAAAVLTGLARARG